MSKVTPLFWKCPGCKRNLPARAPREVFKPGGFGMLGREVCPECAARFQRTLPPT